MTREVILSAQGLSKSFGGFLAVNDVSLSVEKGAIHALIGPNGAGKSTLFQLISRLLPPTRGSITFKGRDITKVPPAEVARLGLVQSFQISSVFPHMSALQNVCVALQRRRFGDSLSFWSSARKLRVLQDEGQEWVEQVGLGPYRDVRAGELSYGRKRALELATTLSLDPDMLLLDEPLAGMTEADIAMTCELIAGLRGRRTILMVEHNISVVASLCDRITVLGRGRVLTEGDYASVSADPRVIEAYIGDGDE